MNEPGAPAASDFLANVIERAYERVPLLAPRRASWFEPADDAAAETDDTRPVMPAAPAPPDERPPPAMAMPPPLPPGAAAAPQPAVTTPVAAAAAATVPLAPATHRETRHDTPHHVMPAAQTAMKAPAVPAIAASQPPGRAVARPAASIVPPAVPPRVAAVRAAPAPDDGPRANAVAAAQPEPALVQSFAATAARLARRDAPVPAAPQVTISIGRVEVRGTAPAAAARTVTPPRTAALADYLGRKERTR